MHEMAIAEGILEIALEYAAREAAVKVNTIALRVGDMTNVDVASLEFCFSSLAKATIAANAVLQIERRPLVIECQSCKTQQAVAQYCFVCEVCGSANTIIVSGRELQVEYLEMD